MNSSGDVFLTGATGFVGPAVLRALRESGRSIVALVRTPVELDGVRTLVGSLEELEGIEQEVSAAGAVVHLANSRTQDRATVVGDDIYGTARLVDGWRRGPFVYASSVTVHGVPRQRLDETAPIDILTWYDLGKYANEFQLRDATSGQAASRGPAISLRPTIYLGDNERRNDRQILGMLYQCYAEGMTFVFESDEALETTGVSYVGVEDFGRAVVAALDMSSGGPFEVAGGFATWRELIELVARMVGKPAKIQVRAGIRDGPEHDPERGEIRLPHSRTEQDASAFMAASGWQPQQGLDELVDRYLRAELGQPASV